MGRVGTPGFGVIGNGVEASSPRLRRRQNRDAEPDSIDGCRIGILEELSVLY